MGGMGFGMRENEWIIQSRVPTLIGIKQARVLIDVNSTKQ